MVAVVVCLFAGLLAWKQPAPDLTAVKRGNALVEFIESSEPKVTTHASFDQCMLSIEEHFTHGCPPVARYRTLRIEADLTSVSHVILRAFEDQTYMIFAPKGSAVKFRKTMLKCDGDLIEMKSPATLSMLVPKSIEIGNADELSRVVSDCNDLMAQD